MRRPNEQLAEKRKNQILQAAARCFVRSGFHNTGMQEICKTADMSPGAVYRYFASKDAIIEAIVAQEQHEFTTELEKISRARSFKKALLDFVEQLTLDISEPDYNVIATEIIAEAARNKKVADIIAKTEQQSTVILTRLIRTEVENGRLHLSLSVTETAQTILSLAYGCSTQILLNPKLSAKKLARLARKVVEQIIS